jgi:hypothetical protein
MQIVRDAHAYSRLEATKSEAREMDAHAAVIPTPAIDISEKRSAEEAEETLEEAAKVEETDPAAEAAEAARLARPAEPSYHERLVKETDAPKTVEDLGGDLGYRPKEIRALEITADQTKGQLDLAESIARRAPPTVARHRSLNRRFAQDPATASPDTPSA